MQNTEEFRKKKTLISAILNIELDMFIRVPTNGICRCKEDLDSLRIHRKAQFMAWSLRTLESYLDDLEVAQRTGLNLMQQKYAIMNKQIDGQMDDHIFDRILDIQLKWQGAVIEKYPHMMRQARPLSAFADTDDCISFETYLRGELASYSRRTLRLLYEDFRIKLAQGINISEEIYSFLAIDLGYASLQEAEMMAK